VDKNNVDDTVIADNFLAKEEICQGLSADVGGVCP